MSKQEQRTRRVTLNSDSLRARSLEARPSLTLVEKRIDMLIKFFSNVHEERIYLNDWIRVKTTGKTERQRRQAVCKIGDTVNNCGSVACVGGFTVILFAPASLKIDGMGQLRYADKSVVQDSVGTIAQILMGLDSIMAITKQISLLADIAEVGLEGDYYEDTADDWLSALFNGSDGTPEEQRETALARLSEFKYNIRTLRKDAKLVLKECASAFEEFKEAAVA